VVEEITWLRVENHRRAMGSNAWGDFVHWAREFRGNIAFLTWSGGEEKQLARAFDKPVVVDVHKMYKEWLDKTRPVRGTDTGLEAAVRHVLGPNYPFLAHRAFEDAAATAAIYLALTSREGAL